MADEAAEAARIIEAVAVHPGDTLVVSFGQLATRKVVDELGASLRERLPDSVKILVLGGEIHLHVLRTGEVTE